MELIWTHGCSSSACYAASAICRGLPIVDARLSEQVTDAARELEREISALRLPASRFWKHLLAFSHQFDSNQELARLALRKTVGPQADASGAVARLAGRIADLEAALLAAVPRLNEELAHRSRPIQQHWEARGPGLLRAAALLTDERLFADRANVALVFPAVGGGGTAYLLTNTVHLEGVLTNVMAELPEVLRLGWLLSQLQLDLPSLSEQISGERLEQVAPLAMLPPILQAAETVELGTFSNETMACALAGWRVTHAPDHDLAGLLLDWWATYLDTKPGWSIALAALDQMLLAEGLT